MGDFTRRRLSNGVGQAVCEGFVQEQNIGRRRRVGRLLYEDSDRKNLIKTGFQCFFV